MGQPTAGQALRALEPLVGEWTVEAKGPDGQAWPGQGRASFQWHPSGAHLVQRVTTDVPGAPDSTSIMGCDAGLLPEVLPTVPTEKSASLNAVLSCRQAHGWRSQVIRRPRAK